MDVVEVIVGIGILWAGYQLVHLIDYNNKENDDANK